MVYILLLSLSIVFVELFIFLNIISDAQGVLKLSAESVNVMKSKTMTDDEKEAFMRKNSATMFIATMKFLAKFVLIFAILFGLIYIIEISSKLLAEQVMQSFVSVYMMIALTAATLIYVWIRNVIRGKL